MSYRRPYVIRQMLVERFPLCFAPKGQPKRPLKRKIHKDIAAVMPDLHKQEIRYALKDYCGGPTYLRRMVLGAERIGLDGEPAGTVDENAAFFAARQLRELEAKFPAREAQAKAAREAKAAAE